MGVKNNFSQAVSELIGISKAVESEKDEVLDEEHAENESRMEASVENVKEEDIAVMTEIENKTTDQRESAVYKAGQNPKERIMAMLAQQQQSQPQQQPQQEEPRFQQPQEQMPSFQPKEPPGLTTIARGTVVVGEINAEGDVELLGSVKGKIASKGDIKANGKIVGDLIGKDIELTACAVQGNIIANGSVSVDESSVVVGDVKGKDFCLDGKIKGNVTVENEAKFQPKAILAGNVTTKSIAMSQGAKIQGEVNIPLNEKETDMTFDVDIKI